MLKQNQNTGLNHSDSHGCTPVSRAAELSVLSSASIRATLAPCDVIALVNEAEIRGQQHESKEEGLTMGLKSCLFAK